MWAAIVLLLASGTSLMFLGTTQRPSTAAAPTPKHPFTLWVKPGGAAPVTPLVAVAAPQVAAQQVLSTGGMMGPTRVRVPSLGVTAPLVSEPLINHTSMLSIPPDVHHVGIWSGGGSITGTSGTVLLAGHVNWYNQGNGALYDLATIKPGALINVTGSSGRVTSWFATSLQMVPNTSLPQTLFAGAGGQRELALVTCGGPFTWSTHLYEDNVIVRAQEV